MAEENPPQGTDPEQTNSSAEEQQILDDLTLLNQQSGGNLDVDQQADLGGSELDGESPPGLSMQTIHQGSTQTTEQIIGNLPLQGEVLTSDSGAAPDSFDADELEIPSVDGGPQGSSAAGSQDTTPEGGFFAALNDAGVPPAGPGGTGAPGASPTNTPTPPNTPPGGGGGAGAGDAPGAPAGGPGPDQVPVVDEDPTEPPTQPPTEGPTDAPTDAPTQAPTDAPTQAPTDAPTDAPTQAPTDAPTQAPTDAPTQAPTDAPTQAPTDAPTQAPTDAPTQAPTDAPTQAPTDAPTQAPTDAPTQAPTDAPTQAPTQAPTDAPTQAPTDAPTQAPTDAPTQVPTDAPTQAPTDAPTQAPTDAPTQAPTDTPTEPPTEPIDDVAETPTIHVGSVTGAEDNAIPLNIQAALSDTDGSETLSVTISGVPAGAMLSAGIFDEGTGNWTIADDPDNGLSVADQLANLTITPPQDYFGDFSLSVVATSTEVGGDGDTASTATTTFGVTVTPVLDNPELNLADATGTEDQPITLNIDAGMLPDTTVAISDVVIAIPPEVKLSRGVDNGDGTWTLNAEELEGLALLPPEGFTGDIDVIVTAHSADGGSTTNVLSVKVQSGVEPSAEPASVIEDEAVALNIDAGANSTIVIDGLPEGASLSAGTDNGDGTWTLGGGDLDGLMLLLPADFSGDFDLEVRIDGTTVVLPVHIDSVADTPTLEVNAASGAEDQAISLDISAGLTDLDGSESLSIVISGVPEGAVLSAGTDNGDGTWTLTADDLDGLTITPPADFSGDMQLTVTATSTESVGGDTSSITSTLDIHVEAVADAPTLVVQDASGTEDQPIALDIASGLTDLDGSESLSITISGVPDGAVLSAGTDNGDGTWTLTADDLDGLTITPPENSDVDFQLTVTATSTESNGDTATTVGTIDVSVAADADAPTLVVQDASGTEDQPIALDIASGLTDLDGSETLSITISGVPEGAELSAGTDNGDGTWTLSADDLEGLTITPPANSDADFQLTVTATSTDGSDTATTVGTIDVSVAADADAPTLVVQDASGTEDQPIALDIASGLTDLDGSESLSITISGVPEGAELSAGTDNGDGTWTLSADDLEGLTITPPANSDADFQLTVTATSTDGSDTATTVGTIDVSVDASADAPTLVVQDASGTEDQPIALDIASGLTDLDGSESLSITISGVPEGAELSAGTDNGDGTWTLTADDLDGLTITPPENSDVDFQLTVTATATESSGDTATTVGTIDVSVAADADAPTLVVQDASGTEDQPIALDIASGLTDLDGSETLSITISGVPEGAELSAGTDNGDGTWTLTADDLEDLTITPPANSDADFQLTVTATSTDGSDTATTVGTIDVSVAADADAPTLVVQDASGTEDQPIALDIASGLTDLDGSESLSITISGVPEGAELSAGTDNGDGTWTLSADDLEGLTITPPSDSNEDFQLSVTVTSQDGDDTATSTATIDVDVVGDADAPELTVEIGEGTVTDSGGGETQTATIDSSNFNESGSGFTVSARSINPDGTLSEASAANVSTDSGGLGVSGAASGPDGQLGYSQEHDVSEQLIMSFDEDVSSATVSFAKAFSNEGGEGQHEQGVYEIYRDGVKIGEGTFSTENGNTGTFTITAPDGGTFDEIVFMADDTYSDGNLGGDGSDFVITSVDFTYTEGGDATVEYPLDISSNLTDTDGSETLSITVDGLPDGAALSAGFQNPDGSWTLSADDLEDLTIIVSGDHAGEAFDLTVTATATEDDGDTNSVTSTVSAGAVEIDQEADGVNLSADDASGAEDSAIALDIDVSMIDTDGSESMSITITGVPDGAALSAGTDNGDGTWTLAADDLDGLTITPPADSNADFQLGVSVTTTESSTGDTNTVTGTIDVDVQGVADAPTLSVSAEFVSIESSETEVPIAQSILDAADADSTITISGVPDGATLSAGTDNGDGTWTLSNDDLEDLTITPADGSSDAFDLTITVANETEGGDPSTILSANFGSGMNGFSYNDDTFGTNNQWRADGEHRSGSAHGSGSGSDGYLKMELGGGGNNASSGGFTTTINVGEDGNATMTFKYRMKMDSEYEDNEYSRVLVSVDGELVESNGNDYIAQLNGGGDTGWVTVTIDLGQLEAGDHTVTLGGYNNMSTASDEETDIYFNDVSIVHEPDSTTTTVTDSMEFSPETGSVTYNLDIASTLTDTDGSESLSITVTDLPDGSVLSAGTDNGDGTWTLSADDLDGLTVTVPADSGDLTIGVTATSTENDGDTATQSTTVLLEAPDTVTIDAQDASGNEDSAIALDIDISTFDPNMVDTVTITISDVPEGAELSAGTDNGDGTWTLSADDLEGLTITPPANSDADFSLSISATSAEGTVTTGSIDVAVAGVADGASLSVNVSDPSIAAGASVATYQLNLSASLIDTDGSESITGVTVTGVPDGVTLSAGTDNGDGTWTLSADDLGGLTMTADNTVTSDFQLSVNVTTTDSGGSTATSTTLIEAEAPSFGVSLSGGSGSDIVTGTVGDDTLYGGSGGEDALFGGGGNDTLYGSGGADNRLLGGDGNDKLYGSDATGDLLVGGAGNDEAWGGGGNDMYVFRQGDGTDTFHGGSGTDRIVLMGPNGIITDLSQVTITMTSGLYTATGAGGKVIKFQGSNPQGYITMADGSQLHFDGVEELVLKNDVLFDDDFEHVYGPTSYGGTVTGGSGDGNYFGSDGNDVMTGGSDDDLLMGGAGNDTLNAGSGNDIVMGEEGNDKIYAGSGDDFVDGGAGNDTIYGEGGKDTIYGGDGDDYIDGGTGDDKLYGGAGNDTIYGGNGNDTIDGGTGNDTIYGGSGNDIIDGGSGDDTIDGGSGNDTITGGAGDDVAYGGSGDDLFIFGSGDGSDYFHGGDGWTDTIELSDVSGGPGGDSGWTLELDNGATFTQTENGITFNNADVSGTITLADGSELSFEGVEKIEW